MFSDSYEYAYEHYERCMYMYISRIHILVDLVDPLYVTICLHMDSSILSNTN